MDGRMASAQARVHAAYAPKRYDGNLFLDAEPSARKTVLHIPAGSIPCGAGTLELPEIFVGNTEHIGIIGHNGAGKTTLLDHIRELLACDGAKGGRRLSVLDIPQEPSREQRSQILEEVRSSPLPTADMYSAAWRS